MPFDDKGNWMPPGGKWAGQEHTDNVQQAEQMTPDETARRQDAPMVENDLNSIPSLSTSGGDSSLGQEWQGYNPLSANNQIYIGKNVLNPISDFINRIAGSATNEMTMGLSNKMLQDDTSFPLHDALQEPQTASEKTANVLGDILGFLPTGELSYATGGKLAAEGLSKLAPEAPGWLSSIARGIGAGTAYGTANEGLDATFDTRNDGDQSIGQRLAGIGENALGFGAMDLGGYGVGKLLQKTGALDKLNGFLDKYKTPDNVDQTPNDFTQESQQETPTQETPIPTEEQKPSEDQSSVEQTAESTPSTLMAEYNQAVNDEFNRLRDIRNNPPGMLDNGGLIKDDEGYVQGGYKPTSGNPQWYRDFYAQSGRKPTNDELMTIAKDHVLNGENDSYFGNTPAWKPQAAQELEDNINQINEIMKYEKDPQTLESLGNTLNELAHEHDDIMNQAMNEIKGIQKSSLSIADSLPHLTPSEQILHQGDLISTKKITNMPFYRGEMTTGEELGKAANIARQKSFNDILGQNEQTLINRFEGFVNGYKQEIEQAQKDIQTIRGRRSQGIIDWKDDESLRRNKTVIEQAQINIEKSTKKIEELKQSIKNQEEHAKLSQNDLLYVTSQRHTAEEYANQLEGKNSILFGEKPANYNPTVHELVGNFDKVLDLSKVDKGLFNLDTLYKLLKELGVPEKHWEEIARNTKYDDMTGRHGFVYELFRGKNLPIIMDTIKHKGYDAIHYTEGPQDNWVVLDKSKIKTKEQLKEFANKPKEENGPIGQNTDEVKGFFGNSILGKNGKTSETIARNEVVNNLRKNLGLTIDTGRLISKKAQGEYKVTPEVIRSARQGDIATISHEIGHHLEKRLNLIDPKYQADLEKVATPLVKGNKAYTPADYADEGLAEFFRRYLTEDPQQLRSEVPGLYDHIMSKLEGQKIRVKGKKYDVMKGLDQAQKDIHTWRNQGEINQAVGMIDFKSGEKQEPFNWNKVYNHFVDDLNPLKLLEKALKGKVGLGKDSIYKMARNTRGVAEMAKTAIDHGVYLNGQKIGDGLAEIVKPLEELGVSQQEFAAYLVAKHAEDLKALGKQTTFDDAHIQALKDKFDGTPVEEVQKKIVEYNNNLMKVLVDGQVISPTTATMLRKQYPNYVPFMRYFDDDAVNGFKNGGYGASKGFANLSNPIKRMNEEGSQRTIINPFESMVKNTMLAYNAAAKNKVGLQLADMAKIDGAGAWVEHLGEGGRDSKEHIVTVFENGQPTPYKIRDPELYNAMLSLDHESSTFLLRFLGGAASMLRSGATLTPEFMARNLFRDNLEAFVNAGLNPLMTMKGFFHAIRKDDMYHQFLTSGGAQATLMGLDRDYNREVLKKVFRESIKDKAMNVITDPKELFKLFSGYTVGKTVVKGLRKGAELSEVSTRIGKFEQTLKKTGDPTEAAYQSRDLMDFNRAGSNVRQANRAVAFLNAQIQGVDKLARSIKENPAGYFTRAFVALSLPAIASYYINQNLDPERKALYDNIPQWQKDTFYIFPIPGTKLFARVPKPFEAGMLWGTGVERILQYAHGQDPKVGEYTSQLRDAFVPNWIPSMMLPILEGLSNYSFFMKRNIVSDSEQKLLKVDQYGPNTSETAKSLGEVMSHTPFADTNFASPRIIDNTLRGYTAGLGQYAISGIDKALAALGVANPVSKPEKQWYEQPPVSGFMANTQGGGQVRQDFYDQLNSLSREYNSAKHDKTLSSMPQTDMQNYGRMNAVKNGIDKIMRVYKQAQADPKLNPQEKRQVLDGLDQRMDQLAQAGLGRR